MRLLLDTHIFLWLAIDPARLGERLGLLEDRGNDVLLSAASAWEIAIKHRLGRLALPREPRQFVPEMVRALGLRDQSILRDHALAIAELPDIHRDPFDRVLVAQAIALDAVLVTADATLARYPVESLLVA